MALASAAQETVWMRQLSNDIKIDTPEPTIRQPVYHMYGQKSKVSRPS